MKKIISAALLLLNTVPLYPQWEKISFPSTEYLWCVRFATEQIGWVAGHQYIYKTTNGGTSWTKQDTSIGGCFAMYVLNDQTAVFANWTGAGELSRGIRRTTDGGVTWSNVDAGKNYYTDFDFGTATVGYASSGGATGSSPLVKKSTDAGASWATISQNFPKAKYELTGVSFVDASNGWVVSYDGFVYHTTNGGTEWTLQDSLGFESFRDIEFLNNDTGWAVGGISGDKVIARTTNGGVTWTKTKTVGASLREVQPVTSRKVWIAGASTGEILFSTNAGEAWVDQAPVQFLNVESIFMASESVGFVVAGASGAIYKTTNGGITSVINSRSDLIPERYALEQNFPNPFNPATTMRFSLPEKEEISLKVYSVTGKLVEELLHRTMAAGTHTISWNAEKYPSGVYFYTLTTNTYTETKKLVLMK